MLCTNSGCIKVCVFSPRISETSFSPSNLCICSETHWMSWKPNGATQTSAVHYCPIMLYATLRTTNLFLFISFLLCSSITAVLLFHSHVNCRLAWRDTLLRFSPTPQPAAFPASCRSQRDPRHKRPGFIISHLGLPRCGSEHHVHPIIRHVKATVVERFCELKELLGKCHWATSSLVCCQFILGLFKK